MSDLTSTNLEHRSLSTELHIYHYLIVELREKIRRGIESFFNAPNPPNIRLFIIEWAEGGAVYPLVDQLILCERRIIRLRHQMRRESLSRVDGMWGWASD
jgi:hypothetical protein